ncbi:MAG: SCO5389 family protein [Leptodesmis sp.]|uniref:SCO5389 family protein n=1 Tax=Leptodesmis sp. TaxID=3100501 RepID=UPI003D14F1FE
MSLNVSEALIQQAAAGEVDEPAFVETIRQSLPYAWNIVEKLSYSIQQEGEEWANHAVAPPNEQARGQLLRMVGGDVIRGAVERHFNVKLAFQNCHNLAAFRRDRLDSAAYRNFTSIRNQILNQTPELQDC